MGKPRHSEVKWQPVSVCVNPLGLLQKKKLPEWFKYLFHTILEAGKLKISLDRFCLLVSSHGKASSLGFLLKRRGCCCQVASIVSDSVRPHRRQPTRLLCPWDSPGKNTGVGCHFLLQCMKVKSQSEVSLSCPTLSNPMDCSPPGSSVHWIFQARVLVWGATAFANHW